MPAKNRYPTRYAYVTSVVFLVLVFALVVAATVIATFYATGILGLNNSSVAGRPVSIVQTVCDTSGVFFTLSNNLDQVVSVSEAVFESQIGNFTLYPYGSITGSPSIPADGRAVFYSSAYKCTGPDNLVNAPLFLRYNSSVTQTYYNPANQFWDAVTSQTISSTVRIQ